MIEETGDVVFGVAGDDAQTQFVFHISTGDVMRGGGGWQGDYLKNAPSVRGNSLLFFERDRVPIEFISNLIAS